MYKLGPIHQGILERGAKTSSDSYILWPSRIYQGKLVGLGVIRDEGVELGNLGQGDGFQDTCHEGRILAVTLEQDVGQPTGHYGTDDAENGVDADDGGGTGQVIALGFLQEDGD